MKLLSLIAATLAATAPLQAADFALHDGDTVAFLGDSITAARGYTKIVEHYTLMRFPDRRVRFINAGQGGDTAHGCLERLERDVFSKGATVLTVAFGINDIGWGTKADDTHRQLYLDGIREIIGRSRKRGIRVFICSPAITAEAPDTAEKGYLQGMVDEGMGLARSLSSEVASRGITVNVIAPGLIDTDMTMELGDGRDALLSRVPLGRIGNVSDVAGCAFFLASDESRYITGTVIRVDGGLAMGW